MKDEAVGLAVGSEVEARAMATPGSEARVVEVKAAAATGREMVGATAVKRVVGMAAVGMAAVETAEGLRVVEVKAAVVMVVAVRVAAA